MNTLNSSSIDVSGGPQDDEITADAADGSDERVGEAVDSRTLEEAVGLTGCIDEDVEEAGGSSGAAADEAVEDAVDEDDEGVGASCCLDEGRLRGGHSEGSR